MQRNVLWLWISINKNLIRSIEIKTWLMISLRIYWIWNMRMKSLQYICCLNLHMHDIDSISLSIFPYTHPLTPCFRLGEDEGRHSFGEYHHHRRHPVLCSIVYIELCHILSMLNANWDVMVLNDLGGLWVYHVLNVITL